MSLVATFSPHLCFLALKENVRARVGVAETCNDQDAPCDWPMLVARVREQDPGADRQLVEALWPGLTKIIARLCPQREVIEDLAQDSFMRIFSKLYLWRGDNFEAWCRQITRRVCYDALRKARVRPEWTFAELDEIAHPSASREREKQDAISTLAQLFNQIPSEMAWLLTEVELRGESIGEISKSMGWTATAGRLRLMRARRRLKQVYTQLNTL